MILTQTDRTTKTKIRYSRSLRTWQAVNGAVINCASREDALMVALRHDHPQLAERVTAIAAMHNDRPELVTRLIKSAQLVTKNHVNGQTVTSQAAGDNISYTVTFAGLPKKWECNCPDFARGGIETDYGRMCKHSLAALLDYLIG